MTSGLDMGEQIRVPFASEFYRVNFAGASHLLQVYEGKVVGCSPKKVAIGTEISELISSEKDRFMGIEVIPLK